jgi:hypothetical protein
MARPIDSAYVTVFSTAASFRSPTVIGKPTAPAMAPISTATGRASRSTQKLSMVSITATFPCSSATASGVAECP